MAQISNLSKKGDKNCTGFGNYLTDIDKFNKDLKTRKMKNERSRRELLNKSNNNSE